MRCRIAGLCVDVPPDCGLAERCVAYLCADGSVPDITIREAHYRPSAWPTLSLNDMVYMESGIQFYVNLLRFDGLMLHASAVAMDSRAYLFSGPCGVGKSTHTRLWQNEFGQRAVILNDDKPALRRIDGKWIACGTPWCGKDGINRNASAPIAGICFLKRGETAIRRLATEEALGRLLEQTLCQLRKPNMDRLLTLADNLLTHVPVFELTNHADPACARLSYATMRAAAEEGSL